MGSTVLFNNRKQKMTLQQLIAQDKAAAAASWANARIGAPKCEWATYAEAVAACPGFSSAAFWKDQSGNWRCA